MSALRRQGLDGEAWRACLETLSKLLDPERGVGVGVNYLITRTIENIVGGCVVKPSSSFPKIASPSNPAHGPPDRQVSIQRLGNSSLRIDMATSCSHVCPPIRCWSFLA
jgi:hypothetical protein